MCVKFQIERNFSQEKISFGSHLAADPLPSSEKFGISLKYVAGFLARLSLLLALVLVALVVLIVLIVLILLIALVVLVILVGHSLFLL